MSSALTNVATSLTSFLSWWSAELAGLLPRALTRGAQPALPNRFICIEDGGLRLIAANGTVSPELVAPTDAITQLAAENKRSALRLGVRVPYRACFSRRVELPNAAARDFPRLLALDLERATPFKPRDVRSAYFIEDEPRTPGKTSLRQLVLKRSAVDDVILALQDAGLNVTQVDCWSQDGQSVMPVNFLDVSPDTATQNRGWFWPLALTASAAGLAAFGGYTFLERHDVALAGIKSQNAKLRQLVQEKGNLEEEARVRQAEVRNFAQVLASAPSKAIALEELTRLLPDTARITDLKLDGTTVDITGVAQSAIGLMPILERSTVFVNAEQTAPIMTDQREGKDRFSIRVRIRSSSAETKPVQNKPAGRVQ
jgi:general secretion pathway protein L